VAGGALPNMLVRDSAASRKSVVWMALALSASTGTSVKDFLKVSRRVPPGGIVVAAILRVIDLVFTVSTTNQTMESEVARLDNGEIYLTLPW